MQEFKKSVFNSGKNILNIVDKTSRENNNLIEWIKIYDKQIKENEKEIYDLNVRLYFLQQQQQQQNYPQHQPKHQSHQLQLNKPKPQQTFKSLADYFEYHATTATTTVTSLTEASVASTALITTSTATTTASTASTASTATSTATSITKFESLAD